MTHSMIRKVRKPLAGALALSLAAMLGGCGGMATNTQLESIHQPVVQRTNFSLDLTSGPGGLSVPEQRRLSDWFAAMDLRYGDKVYIDDPLSSIQTRSAVEAVASRYGMLVGEDAPATAGYVNAGAIRVIVARSTATVPGCPDAAGKSDTNFRNATSHNYGCAINSNLAAMVADPEHLIRGARGNGETVVMSSTKAIDSYRSAAPTGAGGLKQSSSKDN
jgi:pilus assembly protein CpaD